MFQNVIYCIITEVFYFEPLHHSEGLNLKINLGIRVLEVLKFLTQPKIGIFSENKNKFHIKVPVKMAFAFSSWLLP